MSDIKQAKSKDIANYVVIYKILGIHRELSIECMEELHRRKQAGDDFDYMSYIDEEVEKSPKSQMSDKDKNILLGMFKMNFK